MASNRHYVISKHKVNINYGIDIIPGIGDMSPNNKQLLTMFATFEKLETHVERINYLFKEMDKIGVLYKIGNLTKFIKNIKMDDAALEAKELGNKFFAEGKLPIAHNYYTQAVALAKSKDILSVAYANRSAVLNKLNMHKECLLDIEEAFENKYPKESKPQLLIRRKSSLKKLKFDLESYYEEIPEIPDSERSSTIPCGRNCIETKYTAKYGTHIIASRDIEIGEVLLVEKHYSTVQTVTDYIHCNGCLEVCYNLIPCENCTQALYCGNFCKVKALKYHKYECPVLIFLAFSIGTFLNYKYYLYALRMTLLFIMEEAAAAEKAPFNQTNERAFHVRNLSHHLESHNTRHLFDTSRITAQIFNLVKNHTTFFDDFEGCENQFKEHYVVNYYIAKANCSEIGEISKNFTENSCSNYEMLSTGCAMFPYFNLFNHSCFPNVIYYHHGTTVVLRACRTIKKEEQCFISYGHSYSKTDKVQRQSALETQFHFTCACRACTEDWRYMSRMINQSNCLEYKKLKDKLCETADRSYVGKLLMEFQPKLKDLEYQVPSCDYDLVSDIVQICYCILGNKKNL